MAQKSTPVSASSDSVMARAKAAHQRGQLNEAAQLYRAVLINEPKNFDALHLLGVIAGQQDQHEAAAKLIGAALEESATPPALNNYGNTLLRLQRAAEALAVYDRAIALRPDYAEAFNNRGLALRAMGWPEEALESFSRAIRLRPNYTSALAHRGQLLYDLKRPDEALADVELAANLNEADGQSASIAFDLMAELCDWRFWRERSENLIQRVSQHQDIVPGVTLLACDAPEVQFVAAQVAIARHNPPRTPLVERKGSIKPRLRIGYISADFHNHPVMQLAVDMFERHDRASFETVALSLGPSDGSQLRARLERAFDRFLVVPATTIPLAAQAVAYEEIDILVDLTGHTRNGALSLLAHRPAPLAVTFLGYAGSTGAPYIDYILADKHVITPASQGLFSEQVVQLPGTFMPHDSKQMIAQAPSRADAGLPETGFVFCCFSKSTKITEAMFGLWMRLLREVEGSVLWLKIGEGTARNNLSRAAASQGVDPARLIFASFAPGMEEHLARLSLADLFLDTFPYNAHSVGVDALMAGVPIITRAGQSFPTRVAGSLLSAVGLTDLITSSLADYEALALRLVNEPGLLASFRARLAARERAPFFDMGRYTRSVETAYQTMWHRHAAGLAPETFAVPGEL